MDVSPTSLPNDVDALKRLLFEKQAIIDQHSQLLTKQKTRIKKPEELELHRYCDDGRLPISNIQYEHVAKTIALARKNFLFADTPAGANASAMLYSILKSATANGRNTHRYMAVVLTALPAASSVDDIEALLPWNLAPESVDLRYAELPAL